MAHNNNSQNQAPLPPPTIFRCPACPRIFEGSVSFSRHFRLHKPHERVRRRNVEPDVAAEEVPRVPKPVDEAVEEPLPRPPAALSRSRNAVGNSRVLPPVEGAPKQPVVAMPGAGNVVGGTRSRPFSDLKGLMGEGNSKKGRKEAGKKTKSNGAVEEAVIEAPQPPPSSVALPQSQVVVVPPSVVPEAEIVVEQPRARPMFDLNKLPDEQHQ